MIPQEMKLTPEEIHAALAKEWGKFGITAETLAPMSRAFRQGIAQIALDAQLAKCNQEWANWILGLPQEDENYGEESEVCVYFTPSDFESLKKLAGG